jgi:hypothetical protein
MKTNAYAKVGIMLDTGCLMLDKIRIITFKNTSNQQPASSP